MSRTFTIILLSCLLVACASGSALRSTTPVLRSTGVGPVAFGSTLAETEVLLGDRAAPPVRGAGCQFVEFGSLPGLRFMVEDGVVTRADADPGIRTELGVQVGDSTDAVIRLYPDVLIQNNDKVFDGIYLAFPGKDKRHAIIMESVGNKVTAIRAGVEPSVGYVDGCP